MAPRETVRLVALMLISFFAAAAPAWAAEPLRLGVLGIRPKPLAIAQWQPLANHLQAAMARPVELEVYSLAELDRAVTQNRVDVVLTNPSHYVRLQHQIGLSGPLVTLVPRNSGQELQAFGGVIFTRAAAEGIATLRDLAGKRVAAVQGEDAFGGYLMQALELVEAGVAPPQGERLLITGKAHDQVVEAVLAGSADAGFVRTGVIEAMVAEGKLDAGKVKIIGRQTLPAFPYASSTRLYPEWPVVVMPHVDERLARRLTVALLSVAANGSARADLPGFTNPASYAAVENLMRRLRQPPFDAVPEFTLADLWAKYAAWITVLALLLQLLVLAGVGLAWQNRRIRQARERLEHIAHHDTLTNLPNRLLLGDRLHQAMAQTQRRGQTLALVYVDIDGFKEINDSHGHDVGDELLIILGRRLKAVLREGDTLARFGGDEFVALLVDLERTEDCVPVLDRLLLAAADPVTATGGQVLQVSASIGVSFYPQDGADVDHLLRHADHAMYVAKQSGGNRYCLFTAEGAAAPQP